MADIIQLLSDSVANQIAAGEVVQRPASVVKELVENSIDAEATKVLIYIKDAGRTLIQITDNGKGMSPTDARMSFERHATSKIRQADDLFCIRTMGFRGEALASIASVADVLMKTKRPDDEVGTSIHISGSEIVKQESEACSDGTTFMVKNLFFNVPARRKFLKSNSVEFKHIINEVQRVALANPAIAFCLYNNDSLVYDLPSTNQKKRIDHLFGNSIGQNLLPINTETSILKISGFIGQPKAARKSFGEQFFFVNNRFMKHPYFHRAVVQAYDKIIAHDAIPQYFIFFDIDPLKIDINIHPTKTEIKFEDENAIWQLIHAVVRESLGKFNVIPSIDFDQSGSFEIPIAPKTTEGLFPPPINIDPTYNPFNEKSHTSSGVSGTDGYSQHIKRDSNIDSWQSLYQVAAPQSMEENIDFDNVEGNVIESQPNEQQSAIDIEQYDQNKVNCTNNILSLKGKYLLTPVKSGLMVIDQHRAHQRILYEQFLSMINSHIGVCQQLLFPQTLELQPADSVVLLEILSELNEIGFDIREFGNNTFIISGLPSFLDESNAKTIVETFMSEYKNNGSNLKDKACEHLANSLASASAIDYGQTLTNEEAGQLIDCLFACQSPNYSPSGKPIVEIIQLEEIEKKLK